MGPSRSGTRAAAGAVAFLLPVLYSPSVSASGWTPKAALLLLVLALGLPRLVPLLRSEARLAAVAGVAFLGAAGLATALSPRPGLALFGLYNVGTGLLFVAALGAAWALGASLEGRGARIVQGALLAAVAVNVLVALIQGAVPSHVDPFTRFEGRAAGLLANPVQLGAFAAASFPLLLPRVRANPRVWAPALALVAAAVQLSGSRFALGLAVLVVAVAVVRERAQALSAVAALAVGILLGVGVGALGGATVGTGRIESGTTSSGGVTARLGTWASARHSIAAHPIVGLGPGQFRPATSPYRTLEIARAEGADRYYVDAHNLVVEYATTTGALGLAALLAFVALAWRRAGGPLLGFAAVLLAMHLAEPQFVGTTSLAFLALGAAGYVETLPSVPLVRPAALLAAVVALLAGGRLLLGDYRLDQARLDFSAAAARSAAHLLPPWPEPAELVGRVALFHAIRTHAPPDRDAALLWRGRAATRDPTNPHVWTNLGEAQAYFGDLPAATRSFRQALRWDPWSVLALDDLGHAAATTGDRATARAAFRRSLRVLPQQDSVRRMLADVGG
jgi:O-antigen ligase